MSFCDRWNVAVALSENTVGHGAAAVHGGGVRISVTTSDCSVPDGGPAVTPPRDACSVSSTTNTGERPWRTTSPHDTLAAAAAASTAAIILWRMCIEVITRLPFADARRDE